MTLDPSLTLICAIGGFVFASDIADRITALRDFFYFLRNSIEDIENLFEDQEKKVLTELISEELAEKQAIFQS